MKKAILSIILSVGLLGAQNNFDTAWVCTYGGDGKDVGNDIKQTADGGFIIAGNTNSFGYSYSHFYLIKVDSIGNKQWSRVFGSGSNNSAQSVEINQNGYTLIGYGSFPGPAGYDGQIIRCDLNGNTVDENHYGSDGWDFFYGSTTGLYGKIIAVGESYLPGRDDSNLYIALIDSTGNLVWSKSFGSSGDDSFYEVVADSQYIYAAGKYYDTIKNVTEAYVCKFDLNGNVITEDRFSQPGSTFFSYSDMVVTKTGDLLLGGHRIENNSDRYLIRRINRNDLTENAYNTFLGDYFIRSIVEGHNTDIYHVGPKIGGIGGYAASISRFDAGFMYISGSNFGGIFDEDANKIIKTRNGYAFVGWSTSYGKNNLETEANVYLVIFNKPELVNDYFLIQKHVNDTLSPVSIHENRLAKFKMYPNPTEDKLHLQFSNLFNASFPIQYRIFDHKGAVLINGTIQHHREIPAEINLTRLNIGIYTIELITPEAIRYTGQIIRQ